MPIPPAQTWGEFRRRKTSTPKGVEEDRRSHMVSSTAAE